MTERNDIQEPSAAATGPAVPAGESRPRRWPGVAMLAEAVTFGIASYLHLDGRIPLGFVTITGEHFRDAAIPEAIIGSVLAAGALCLLAGAARGRGIALAVTGFAIAGTAVGIGAVSSSGRPSITADLAYHAVIMAALLVTFAGLLAAGRGRPASGSVPGNRTPVTR